MRARAEDIRSIGQRILIRLQAGSQEPRQYPEHCILVGEEIGAAQLVEVPIEQLAGIVCTRGSVLSHTAILARALGIPAVMGVGDLPIGRLEGTPMAIDGYLGQVLFKPTPSMLAGVPAPGLHRGRTCRRTRYLLPPARRNAGRGQNTHLCQQRPALRYPAIAGTGAEGIGLYRTEFTFMVYESFPSEDQQYQIYRQVLESFAPQPVTMRTLDIGGDKSLPYFPVIEDNSLLGWRGIRVSLDHPEIFLTQLRAMLRANADFGNLRILFPMISSPKEVDQAKDLLERAYLSLLEEGQAVTRTPVGVLIEVPAAAYQIGPLAQRVDFFSIGTNDLTQYLLAANRNNARVASLCDSLNPAVIRVISEIIQGAYRCARPVGICGEMAGDPAAVIVLLGMGVATLSMASPSLPRVKWVIRSFTRWRARELLDEALLMEDAVQVRKMLNNELEQAGLGALVRALDNHPASTIQVPPVCQTLQRKA
ncbi:MAG: phosphoenolpyruvate--protein phosphotransferase [Chromatiales bacterium]|nr:phosphoenolpyruvate--protein phosphotransferase [Chromatiales bacterium]